MFDIEVEGFDELEREWSTQVAKIGSGTRKSVGEATRAGERVAQAHAPSKTNSLRDKIEGRVLTSDSMSATGEVKAGAKYSSFVKDGTKPHIISAKNGKSLAFVSGGNVQVKSENVLSHPRSGGGSASYGMVFVRRVHHPGTKPNDFWSLCELATGLILEQAMNRIVDAACDAMNT